jgi:regulator of sirC expression with transglutaminase-like and TPR domain
MGVVEPLLPIASCPWWHERFVHCVTTTPIALAEASYALSAHRSSLAKDRDGFAEVAQTIDELSAGVVTLDEWRHRLFVDAGFTGNGADYHDPRNSFLPDVLTRRLGIPITLALVGRLVADRAGLISWGIGFPGHFLLGVAPAGATRGIWWDGEARIVDPFSGGRTMTVNDVSLMFSSMFGTSQTFHRSMLAETGDALTLIRMLANLKANYARANDLDGLTAIQRLRTCLPEWSLDEGRELLRLLAATGSFDEAIAVLDQLDIRFPEADELLVAERVRLARSLN